MSPLTELVNDHVAPARRVLPIAHTRIHEVEEDIFTARFAPDCMTHACLCRDQGDRGRLDACCQHGADVDLFERDGILARAHVIQSVLAAPWRDPRTWFDQSAPEHDADFPSGTAVRTAVAGAASDAGCVFLQHDRRGCALHRAALAAGFAPEEIKPAVCRLYPLAYGGGVLGLSDDFDRYSCAGHAGGPTVYRLMRATVADVFRLDLGPDMGLDQGRELVRRLDQAERKVLRRKLPLLGDRATGGA